MPPSKKVARPPLPRPDDAARRGRTRTEVTDAEARTVRATLHAADTPTKGQVAESPKRQGDKVSYYVPRDITDEIAILARRRRTSASAVVTEALAAYVAAAKAAG